MSTKSTKRTVRKKIVAPKDCVFCKEGKEPSYVDAEVLRRFLTERGKIISRIRTGLCAFHQRRMTTAIKRARHLALLPYMGRH